MGKRTKEDKKLKVDILTPIRYGGPQKWGDDLAKAFRQKGVEAQNIHSLFGILRRFFYTDADIIHSALPFPFNLQGKPIILTIHGNYKREKNLSNFLRRLSLQNAKTITVPSYFLKKKLGLKKAVVISNAIHLNNLRPIAHRSKKVIKIVTLTSFSFWDKARGVIDLLEILKGVEAKTRQKFEFIVIGGGKHLESVKSMALARKYKFPVKFIGFHSHPIRLLRKSDIFVYYSHLDNLPIAIMEGIASGLPVVSNDVGAVGEMVKTSKSKKEFLDSVLSYLSNPSKRANDSLKNLESLKKKNKEVFDNFVGAYKRWIKRN